jgi:hypothetical protein
MPAVSLQSQRVRDVWPLDVADHATGYNAGPAKSGAASGRAEPAIEHPLAGLYGEREKPHGYNCTSKYFLHAILPVPHN